MINEAPLARFAPLAGGLLKPIYADYSFANIANTIEHLLTGAQRGPLLPADCFGGAYPRPRKVVTFFVDSFGWAFWKAHGDRFRTTRAVMEKGVVTPISALFPSTTAASVSTLNLGVPPSAHALYEWNIYIPAYGEVIQSLAFAPLGRHGQDACVKKGYDPAKMLEVHETVHQRLARHGVRSVQFSNRSYAGSAYNSVASAGADVIRHGTLAEALVQLKEMLRADAGQGLARLLLGFDRHHRPHPRPRNDLPRRRDRELLEHLRRRLPRRRQRRHALSVLRRSRAGLCRRPRHDLHQRALSRARRLPAREPDGQPDLSQRLPARCLPARAPGAAGRCAGHAATGSRRHRPRHADGRGAAIRACSGPDRSVPELRRRLGDILILPFQGHFVWWRERGVMANTFNGHHGGLAPDELITVFGAIDKL